MPPSLPSSLLLMEADHLLFDFHSTILCILQSIASPASIIKKDVAKQNDISKVLEVMCMNDGYTSSSTFAGSTFGGLNEIMSRLPYNGIAKKLEMNEDNSNNNNNNNNSNIAIHQNIIEASNNITEEEGGNHVVKDIKMYATNKWMYLYHQIEIIFQQIGNICKLKIGVLQFLKKLKNNKFKVILVSQNIKLIKLLIKNYHDLFTSDFILTDFNFNFDAFLKQNKQTDCIAFCETKEFADIILSKGIPNLRFAKKLTTQTNETPNGNEEKQEVQQYIYEELLETVCDVDLKALGIEETETIKYSSKVTPLSSPTGDLYEDVYAWNTILQLSNDLVVDGTIVKGFGRGSALLGIPTANVKSSLPLSPHNLPGVYYGYCYLSDTPIEVEELGGLPHYPMVMSLGYNPYFQNKELSVEPYLFATFDYSLLGMYIHLVAVGMIRCEANYPKFDHLIQAIQLDCEIAKIALKSINTFIV